jgi:hypothetical protein
MRRALAAQELMGHNTHLLPHPDFQRLEQISADLNREGDSQVTPDERFWRH